MKSLENLLAQERLEKRLEGFLVFYSCDALESFEPSKEFFDGISAYADSLNKQFGVPSPGAEPTVPSPPTTPETFDPQGIIEAVNTPYESSLGQEEINYANKLNQQFGVPSPSIEPIVPSPPATPETFDPNPILEAVNNPIVPSLSDSSAAVSSFPAQPVEPVYKQEPLNVTYPAEGIKTDLPRILPYKGGISSRDEIFDSKPFKYYDSFRRREVNVLTKGIYNKADFLGALDLFENNDLPKIYKRIKQNLNMEPNAVKSITLTNPLYAKSSIEEGPNCTTYDDGTSEIRLPITQPMSIPFIKTSRQKYRDIVLNSFLPHEQSHANIDEKYGTIGLHNGLKGFNEHLANTMAKDSMGSSFVKAEASYQDMWAGSPEDSNMMEDYGNYLGSEEDASKVPANIATIGMLGNQELKERTDNILNDTLENLYPDERFRERISNEIYELSRIYRTKALKITELSKRNTIVSDFKAKRLLTSVEKRSLKFSEGL